MSQYDNFYRVSIRPDTKQCSVTCLDIDRVDSTVEGEYHSVDVLPLAMQERIALLMMIPLEKPTKWVEGVGRRIDEHTYWVYFE